MTTPDNHTPGETPRTDAETCQPAMNDDYYVEADFARQLERELAQVTKERDEARKDAENLRAKLVVAYKEFDMEDFCANCGQQYSLHKYEGNNCPSADSTGFLDSVFYPKEPPLTDLQPTQPKDEL